MSKKALPGVGLDIGTMNIVASRGTPDGKTLVTRVRDAFLDLEPESKMSLKLARVDYVTLKNKQLIVIGDAALRMATLFKREARRPLSKGVISAGELDAQEILLLLIQQVVGQPLAEFEKCYYSVPAAPIDVQGQDVVYHQAVFKQILKTLGYDPQPTNEAQAIIYSQCPQENFSGLAASFGAGMCNVALSFQATTAMEFSVARSGDWVDSQSSKAVGKTAAQMCTIKERGMDLSNPQGRDQEAIALYLRSLIEYTLKNISAQFAQVQNQIDLPDPVPFVVSGGTSLVKGFMELFEDEFERIKRRGFPIPISEVRAADDPLTAVSDGLSVLARFEYEE